MKATQVCGEARTVFEIRALEAAAVRFNGHVEARAQTVLGYFDSVDAPLRSTCRRRITPKRPTPPSAASPKPACTWYA
jgi:hypothetical protein